MEQLVLYRRILYYLEYVFVQVKKGVQEKRLKPTPTAKMRKLGYLFIPYFLTEVYALLMLLLLLLLLLLL